MSNEVTMRRGGGDGGMGGVELRKLRLWSRGVGGPGGGGGLYTRGGQSQCRWGM